MRGDGNVGRRRNGGQGREKKKGKGMNIVSPSTLPEMSFSNFFHGQFQISLLNTEICGNHKFRSYL